MKVQLVSSEYAIAHKGDTPGAKAGLDILINGNSIATIQQYPDEFSDQEVEMALNLTQRIGGGRAPDISDEAIFLAASSQYQDVKFEDARK